MEFLAAFISSYLIAFVVAAYKTSRDTKKSIEHLRKFGVKNFEGYLNQRTPRDRMTIANKTATWGTILGGLACLVILVGLT